VNLGDAIFLLSEMRSKANFTAERVGAPGCPVRIDARLNREALDVAINILSDIHARAAPPLLRRGRPMGRITLTTALTPSGQYDPITTPTMENQDGKD